MKKIIALSLLSIFLVSCNWTETEMNEESMETKMQENTETTETTTWETLTEEEVDAAINELFNEISE